MDGFSAMPGQILDGKYRIEKVLGEGGHGVVVSAMHLTLGERVAIKLLRSGAAPDSESVARFMREARASVRIKGEHVARVLDVGALPNGLPYMVMECLEGSDLSNVLGAEGPLPVQVAVDYALQTCEALAEAHGLGIVHRDIKPSNLFLTRRPDGSPCIKVLDFGISKSFAPVDGIEANLTQTQTVLGSPQYMAPEQMRSSRKVDGRTDIWAIGTTFYEMLTGRAPFEAAALPELFAMILQDTPRPISETRPDVPPALDAIFACCMEKDPARRFANVGELARALGPFAASAGAEVAERVGRVELNVAHSSSRHRASASTPAPMAATQESAAKVNGPRFFVVGAAGFAAAASVILGFVFLSRSRATPPPAPVVQAPSATTSVAPAAAEEPPRIAAATNVAPPAASSVPPPPTPKATSKRDARPRPSVVTSAAAPASASSPVTPRTPGVASSRYD